MFPTMERRVWCRRVQYRPAAVASEVGPSAVACHAPDCVTVDVSKTALALSSHTGLTMSLLLLPVDQLSERDGGT